MASTDARPIPRKNTAFRVTFPIFDADGDLVTGASSLDSEVSIDGGAFADCTSEATEIGSTGFYYLDLTAAEMNGDTIAVQVKTATSGAKTTPLVFYPEEAGDVRVDVVQISGDGNAADNLETACDGGAYNVGGGSVVAASVTGNVGGNVVGSVASVTGAVGSVTGNVGGSVNSVTNKTGYALGATGLDLITCTDPAGLATTFPQMVVQVWRRFFKKSTLTATQLKTYNDDGTTVSTTQTVSDDGTTQTQGAAS